MLRLVSALALASVLSLSASCTDSDPSDDSSATDLSEVEQALSFGNFEIDIDFVYKRLVVTSEFEGADGFPVRFKWYEHLGPDQAYVVFVNGRAEFLEKYDSLFTDLKEFPADVLPPEQTLADLPITFVALDVSGQGGSKEGRVASHVDSVDLWVEEVRELFRVVRKLERHRKPVYLMSHSQGGLVTARFAQTYPDLIDGYITSSPFWAFSEAELPADLIRQLANAYTFGFGLPKLCSRPPGVTPDILGAIAQCANGDLTPECQQCFLDPANCQDETGAQLLPIFAQLQAAGDQGCSDFGFECPNPILTDDDAFCEFINEFPLSGPSATLGYLSAIFLAQDALAVSAPIDVPALILSNPNDLIVNGASHTCDNFSGPCQVITYDTPAHEILTGSRRVEGIAAVKEFFESTLP